MMSDHLTPDQANLYLTAISTDAPADDRIKAAGDLLARPLPHDARKEIRTIYLDLTDNKELAA